MNDLYFGAGLLPALLLLVVAVGLATHPYDGSIGKLFGIGGAWARLRLFARQAFSVTEGHQHDGVDSRPAAGVGRGRSATGHVRVATNPNDGDTLTITVGAAAVVYEIDTGNGVAAGNVLVTRGANAGATATALRAAIHANQGGALASAVHGTDTTVIDLRLLTAGTALTLATESGGRLVVQDNGEEAAPAVLKPFSVVRAVTAEDVTRDRVRIDTGLTSIFGYTLRIRTGATDNQEKAWNGGITLTGGAIELDNGSTTDWAAGNVVYVLGFGV